MNCSKDKRKRVGKPKRVSKACEACKKKKIRCDGFHPCSSCMGFHTKCTYKNREGHSSHTFFNSVDCVGYDLHEAKHNLEKLANSNVPVYLRKSVSSLVSILEEVPPQLYMRMDSIEIKSYSGAKSVETEISGKHSLNKFTSGLQNTVQPFNVYFGIYSPLSLLTTMGLGWMIKKFISYSDDKHRKETVFLLLKYFDAGTLIYQNGLRTSNISRLRFYASSNGIHCDGETVLKHFIREMSCNGIKESKYLSCSSAMNSFQHTVLIMQELFTKLSHSCLDAALLKEFLGKHDLLICLAKDFFQKSIFENFHDLTIVKSSLDLIMCCYWLADPFFFGTITGILCRRCLDTGLNRWEYYIGKQESEADKERAIWWRCYWWDCWYAIISGKPPLISNDVNCCLFPKEVMNLGVDETMDCLSLVESVKLDQAQLSACVSFGYILFAEIISKLFSAILYNRNFTDYRVSTKSNLNDFTALVKKLKIEFLSVLEVFARVQERIIPFLQENLEEFSIFELYINVQFVTICCFQATESLIMRIVEVTKDVQHVELKVYAAQSRDQVFQGSINTLIAIVGMKNEAHSLMCLSSVAQAMMSITAHLINDPSSGTLYHLSLMCGVAGVFSNIFSTTCSDKGLEETASWVKLKHLVTWLFILTRICCQVYTGTHNVSRKEFMEGLRTYNTTCCEIGDSVLNIEFSWYKDLLRNKKKSDMTQTVLDHIDKSHNDFACDQIDKRPEIGAVPKENSFSGTHFTTLEEFLSSDLSLDMIGSIWSEMPLELYGDVTMSSQNDAF